MVGPSSPEGSTVGPRFYLTHSLILPYLKPNHIPTLIFKYNPTITLILAQALPPTL